MTQRSATRCTARRDVLCRSLGGCLRAPPRCSKRMLLKEPRMSVSQALHRHRAQAPLYYLCCGCFYLTCLMLPPPALVVTPVAAPSTNHRWENRFLILYRSTRSQVPLVTHSRVLCRWHAMLLLPFEIQHCGFADGDGTRYCRMSSAVAEAGSRKREQCKSRSRRSTGSCRSAHGRLQIVLRSWLPLSRPWPAKSLP